MQRLTEILEKMADGPAGPTPKDMVRLGDCIRAAQLRVEAARTGNPSLLASHAPWERIICEGRERFVRGKEKC